MGRDDARAEVRALQDVPDSLEHEEAGSADDVRPLHKTTTVAGRLRRVDADAVTPLAAAQGVPVSTLLRAGSSRASTTSPETPSGPRSRIWSEASVN